MSVRTNGYEKNIINRFVETIKHEIAAEEISNKLGYKDIVQNNPHHFGTLNQHVDAVINALPDNVSELVKLSASLHDIGKYEVISVNQKTGYSQYIGHADKSVEILIANREKLCPDLSDKEFEYIKELVRLHDAKYSKQGKCQKMLDEHPNGFARDLITLQYADIMGQSEYQREQKLQQALDFANLIEKVGTPKQIEGLREVIDNIEYKIKIAQEKTQEENSPQVVEHTAANDKNVKYTNLINLPFDSCNYGYGRRYDNHGIILEYETEGDRIIEAKLNGTPIGTPEDYWGNPPTIDEHGDLEYKDGECVGLTTEEEQRLLDIINEAEGRTLEPFCERVEPEKKIFLARTASNKDVYIDAETMEHLQAHNVSIAHIREAIAQTYFEPNPDGSFCKTAESIDLHKITGRDSLTEITLENQELVQSLYRINRDNPSNVIIGEAPETTKLMVAYGFIPGQGIMLFTACAGELAPPESDKDFWDKHALICSKDVIDWERSNSVPLSKDPAETVLLLRKQLSSAIDEIDSVTGKNGQIQQNISTHEKQSEEITQSQKRSEPVL